MKVAILALLVASVGALNFNVELNSVWETYKTQFTKVYESAHEETTRRAIWESTLAYIATHNLEADLGLHTYTLGMNQFSDWTHEEYLSILGFDLSLYNATEDNAPVVSENDLPPAPNDIDWRSQGAVTGVKNQGSCGSCWSFSTTGALEGAMKIRHGVLQSYSEQQLMDCSTAYGNHGCNGGLMTNAFNYVKAITAQGHFDDLESCYPYRGVQGTCNPNWGATCKGATCTGFANVARGSEASLQSALGQQPVAVAIDASHPSFQSYRGGIYNEPACSTTSLDHGVLAVGYDGSSWIVKNSWGGSWGESGYVRMAKGRNLCGIATMASYPSV